jgi:hypothetical protein
MGRNIKITFMGTPDARCRGTRLEADAFGSRSRHALNPLFLRMILPQK